ncbi:hypothetical protein NUM_67680 [Actinocatenispora comari]|jgi:hypothetical protein|uniref:Uncharacterized protein n=1 Tax=Actinocatenispora comari TaxID=2807577 RepID=A0A8J4AHU5_9ACTN|nr:hypothetical protein NUM_67680 [Actinocatenispora comari]
MVTEGRHIAAIGRTSARLGEFGTDGWRGRQEAGVPRGAEVGLRTRREPDVAILHAERYDDDRTAQLGISPHPGRFATEPGPPERWSPRPARPDGARRFAWTVRTGPPDGAGR